MATLSINGHSVTVDDSFTKLSPEDQNSTVEEIAGSLPASPAPMPQDAAIAQNKQVLLEQKSAPWYQRAAQTADDVVRNVADGMTFGLADRLAGAVNGGGYDAEKQLTKNSETRLGPINTGLSRLAGGFATGAGLTKAGLTLAPIAADATGWTGTAARAGLGAVEGGLYGAADQAGHGGDIVQGAGYGAVGGAVLPGLLSLGGKAIGALGGNGLMAKINPDNVASSRLAEALKRAGMTPDDVASSLSSAAGDGQPYMMADALGNAGQRMLAGAARIPNDAKASLVEALEQRQAGQGRRLENALQEGFAAPDTAAQREEALIADRNAAANTAYGQARQDAAPVDLSFLNNVTTKGIPEANTIAKGLNSAKQQFMVDGTPASSFDAALMGKKAVGDMLDTASRSGQNELARALAPIKTSADEALATASPTYAVARDQYAAASKVIDAIGTGKAAAKNGRVGDTIPAFSTMTPEQQAAFRVGYADPYLAGIEGGAHGVNKARALLSDATAQEFPAFAAPGGADRLMSRIGRENTMFETRNAALGGSRTADNMADMHDVSKPPIGLLYHIAHGDFGGVGMHLAQHAIAAGGGTNDVVTRLTKALMQSDPEAARSMLSTAAQTAAQKEMKRNTLINALSNTGSMAAEKGFSDPPGKAKRQR